MLALPDRDCAIYANGRWVALSCNPTQALLQEVTETPYEGNIQDNFFMVSHGRGAVTFDNIESQA